MTFGALRVASQCATSIAFRISYLEGTVSRFTPLALLLSLLPVVASAQESAPDFRHGQWALQFGGNLGLVTLGIMRFSGPRSALVLTFDLTGSFLKGTVTDGLGGSDNANDQNLFFQAGLGKRFYQNARSKVRSFQTIGIVGGYLSQENTFAIGATQKSKQRFGGLEGQVGGAYWLASNISLGGTASASVTYVDRETTQAFSGGQLKQHGIVIQGVDVALVLGIYF